MWLNDTYQVLAISQIWIGDSFHSIEVDCITIIIPFLMDYILDQTGRTSIPWTCWMLLVLSYSIYTFHLNFQFIPKECWYSFWLIDWVTFWNDYIKFCNDSPISSYFNALRCEMWNTPFLFPCSVLLFICQCAD